MRFDREQGLGESENCGACALTCAGRVTHYVRLRTDYRRVQKRRKELLVSLQVKYKKGATCCTPAKQGKLRYIQVCVLLLVKTMNTVAYHLNRHVNQALKGQSPDRRHTHTHTYIHTYTHWRVVEIFVEMFDSLLLSCHFRCRRCRSTSAFFDVLRVINP